VLTHLDPASALSFGLLVFTLLMVMLFEATNGFHDAANAVATVIYTKSLKPVQAVVWAGFMNFLGVLIGGIAVAYALVELLPAEVLTPPDGGPAVAMLVSLFVAALVWNIGTWWFGLPNSSSHCLIGALIGVALGNALARVAWPRAYIGRSFGRCSRHLRCRRCSASCSPAHSIS
jgi:PiT family inorganic phosphate transporter